MPTKAWEKTEVHHHHLLLLVSPAQVSFSYDLFAGFCLSPLLFHHRLFSLPPLANNGLKMGSFFQAEFPISVVF